MNLAQLAVGAFVVGLSGAMSPGPVFAATVAESVRRGARAGPQIVAGHAALEIMLIAALLAGLDRWLRREAVRTALLLGGGLALIALAVRMAADVRADRFVSSPSRIAPAPPSALHPVVLGVVLSLSNPYWILWWATIGLAMLSPAVEQGWPSVAAVYAGHVGADFAWYGAVSAAVARGRRWLSTGAARLLGLACTAGMLWLGGVFLHTGARRLLGAQSVW
ncbi:MAG: LysE family translocator [Kiritimatiellae bacterium]|nr:LysE family translocator [Kiritimatiellia bacterium]